MAWMIYVCTSRDCACRAAGVERRYLLGLHWQGTQGVMGERPGLLLHLLGLLLHLLGQSSLRADGGAIHFLHMGPSNGQVTVAVGALARS